LTGGNELYLLDTNIFLEVILSREYSKVIQDFLNRDITTALFVSDFSVFSVGIFLVRRNLYDQFGTFIDDLEMRDIRTISISAIE
jgi:predicted nucleic acid-binding protein